MSFRQKVIKAAADGSPATVSHDELVHTVGQPPQVHEATHISGGTDPFTSAQLLEAIIKRIRESGGPTDLTVGAIVDGEFLKRSGSTIIGGSPAGGAVNIKSTEIDFGTTPTNVKTFTITDADVGPTSQIMAVIAYEAATGKAADEMTMDPMMLVCKAGSGSFDLYAESLHGPVYGAFKVNYLVG